MHVTLMMWQSLTAVCSPNPVALSPWHIVRLHFPGSLAVQCYQMTKFWATRMWVDVMLPPDLKIWFMNSPLRYSVIPLFPHPPIRFREKIAKPLHGRSLDPWMTVRSRKTLFPNWLTLDCDVGKKWIFTLVSHSGLVVFYKAIILPWTPKIYPVPSS